MSHRPQFFDNLVVRSLSVLAGTRSWPAPELSGWMWVRSRFSGCFGVWFFQFPNTST